MGKTLILGMGNTIRADDGVGIEVVRRLREMIHAEDMDFQETSETGIRLLSLMTGYDDMIIVDAIQTKEGKAGDIYRFKPKDLKSTLHIHNLHHASIPAVFSWAEKMQIPLPKDITFYTVEIAQGDMYREGLTKDVKDAIPRMTHLIKEEISRHKGSIRSLQAT